jgi:hypothetical protein
LRFGGTVKIKGFDTFSKCKSRGGGYRVIHGSPLKMSSRTRLYGVAYVKLKDIASVIRTNVEEEYKILKYSSFYETAKFTKAQSGFSGKLK